MYAHVLIRYFELVFLTFYMNRKWLIYVAFADLSGSFVRILDVFVIFFKKILEKQLVPLRFMAQLFILPWFLKFQVVYVDMFSNHNHLQEPHQTLITLTWSSNHKKFNCF